MCLTLTEDSKRLTRNLRRRKKPITCYKVLTENMMPPFNAHIGGSWQNGSNTSTRNTIFLSQKEKKKQTIENGFHLYLNNPQITHPCPCQYPYQCLYLCLCPSLCRWRCPMIIYKCTVEPKDVVAVGKWNSKTCLVATKAVLHKKIGRLLEKKE